MYDDLLPGGIDVSPRSANFKVVSDFTVTKESSCIVRTIRELHSALRAYSRGS